MKRTHTNRDGVRFIWEGGEYIDVFMGGAIPVDTINVGQWIGEKVSGAEFRAECAEWWDSLDGTDREAYWSAAYDLNR